MVAEALKYDRMKNHVWCIARQGHIWFVATGAVRSVAATLSDALRHRETRKIYVVAGVPVPHGTIKYGLVKAPGHGRGGEGEKMICIHPQDVQKPMAQKGAKRLFRVVASCVTWGMGCVSSRDRSTHQLRAHMAEIGHPIIGDGKYGGSGQENLGDGWGAQFGGDKKVHTRPLFAI